MCLYHHFKALGKICLVALVLVVCFGSNSVEGAEPLRIVLNSDRYPAETGPFLSVQAVGGNWTAPYQLQSVRYVAGLPSDAILNASGYYSPSTGKAYFFVSDARSIYLPGPYSGVAVAINQNLDRFGLGSVVDRQKQIDAVTFKAPDLVDSSTLWPKILAVLSGWVLSAFVLGLPVLVVILGWRRLFQLFLIRELGKTIRGRADDDRQD